MDGGANTAVEALLAKALCLSQRAVSIARGHTARLKQVEVAGREMADLIVAFGPP